MIYLPLARYEFVDDGWYNNQWNIYEADGRIFAHAFSEQAADEIFVSVNYMRGRLSKAGRMLDIVEEG
jgi:hypothetical protein